MLDLGAHAGFGFVLRTLHFIDPVLGAVTTVGEIRGFGRMLLDDLSLSLIGRFTPHPGFLPVQEIRQAHRVVYIGRCGDHGVDELCFTVHPANFKYYYKPPLNSSLP